MKIVFIGGGNMADALIGGMLGKGFTATEITVVDPGSARRDYLSASYPGVVCQAAADARIADAQLIVLAVKPQQMQGALTPLVPFLSRQVVVSIAAGLRLADLSRWLGGYRQLVRTMPNTPALIGAGITGLYAAPEVDGEGRAAAERVLAAVGSTVWIDDEARMDGVTAISGSGPAYVFMFIEALEQAGIELGFPAGDARRLALETVLGAARLAAQSPDAPGLLREKVTSKGGTTEAALRAMAEAGVAAGIVAGVRAAEARGRELGQQLGEG